MLFFCKQQSNYRFRKTRLDKNYTEQKSRHTPFLCNIQQAYIIHSQSPCKFQQADFYLYGSHNF